MERSSGIFEAKSEEFHLKEYECLRKEIELLTQDSRTLERYAIVAVGVTWGWLFSRRAPSVPEWAYCVPCMFAILGAIRAYGINQTFGILGDYISTVENAFYRDGGPVGWEHFEIGMKTLPESKGAVIFWATLNVITLVIAVLGFCKVFEQGRDPVGFLYL